MKPGIIDRIDRVLDRITSITSGTSAFILATMIVMWVVLITLYIIARFSKLGTWIFVPEFTEYFMVAVIFLSFAYTLRSEGHINIDLVVRHFSKKVNNILQTITVFLSLLITCYLIERGIDWFLYGFGSNLHSVGPMHTIMWPVYIIVPIGLFLLALELFLHLYRTVVQTVKGERIESQESVKLQE